MNLGGKTAIITGSSSGIGLGIARAMANAGANVVLNSFTDTDAIMRSPMRFHRYQGFRHGT